MSYFRKVQMQLELIFYLLVIGSDYCDVGHTHPLRNGLFLLNFLILLVHGMVVSGGQGRSLPEKYSDHHTCGSHEETVTHFPTRVFQSLEIPVTVQQKSMMHPHYSYVEESVKEYVTRRSNLLT